MVRQEKKRKKGKEEHTIMRDDLQTLEVRLLQVDLQVEKSQTPKRNDLHQRKEKDTITEAIISITLEQ